MAQTSPPPIGKPVMRLNNAMNLFFEQTLVQLKANYLTQHIWPSEIYPGFAEVNRKRKEKGDWYSTGEGYKSFEGKIIKKPSSKSNHLIASIRYNDYLSYAELGVGAGTKHGTVDRSKKANFKVRYARVWDRKEGKSHRPAILMEARHLQTRMRDYYADYVGGRVTSEIAYAIPDTIKVKQTMTGK